jgi:hypothetical protein
VRTVCSLSSNERRSCGLCPDSSRANTGLPSGPSFERWRSRRASTSFASPGTTGSSWNPDS